MDDRNGASLFQIEIGIVVPAVIYAPVWLADHPRGKVQAGGAMKDDGERFCAAPLKLPQATNRDGSSITLCGRWSRNRSRISNNAKHDGLAASSDTRSIRGQLVHCRNGRSSFRSVKDLWVVWWTFVTVASSFRSTYRQEVKKIWQ
jgi:hypothetical protein